MTKDEMIRAANLSMQIDNLREHMTTILTAGKIELSVTQTSGTKLVIRTTPAFSNFVFTAVLDNLQTMLTDMENDLRALGVEL